MEGEVEGHTVFVGSRVMVDGRDAGSFVFEDEPKSDAREAIHTLESTYAVSTYLVTGDARSQADAIATAVGIDLSHVHAGVKPLEKAECVSEVKIEMAQALRDPSTREAEGPSRHDPVVAFVGDGINDAPALAAADVGITMASGTDVALEAGSVVLMRNRLMDFVTSLRLSRATMRKIKQNLFWALIYNCIMIPLAAFGILAPALAGAAMALSSVSVVSNSLLLKRFK